MLLSQTINLNDIIQSSKKASLTALNQPHIIAPISIDSAVTFGRSQDCNVQLFDTHVSSVHCQIEKRPHGYFVRDLKSKNGIFVNGIKVIEGPLFDGAHIQMGRCEFLFKFDHFQDPLADCPLKSKNRSWTLRLASLKNLSQSGLPVFLQGESGTGKEVLAQVIHSLSPRAQEPFISVNCSALTETLVESELFGHVKGSFTGAMDNRKGAFEAARGGTLFLDEIGDLPPSLQPKLLRALENNEIRPVGSDQVIHTDVRIITATHKNLDDLVRNKLFRFDLYYRIHVIKIQIPSLRERMEDFDDLLFHFCKEYKVNFSKDSIEEMRKYSWPGNIRELKNSVARASALFPKSFIQPEHLPQLIDENTVMPSIASRVITSRPTKMSFLKEFEKEIIKSRLIANNGNQRKTAHELGIPKSTLHDRIKNYGIDISSLTDLKRFEENRMNPAIVEKLVQS